MSQSAVAREGAQGQRLTLSSRILEDEGFTFGTSFLGGMSKNSRRKLGKRW